jgi:alpha-tubulin suppressor-like RCC1 family protein
MNVSNLELSLVQKVNNSTSTLDTLIYSKTLQELKTGTVTTVDTYAQLPAPSASLVGYLYFVKNQEKLYHAILSSSGSYIWIDLDKNKYGLFTWGNNFAGELGLSDRTTRQTPTKIDSTVNSWCAISAGRTSAGIKSDGTLWTWGCGVNGILGNSTSSGDRSSPGTAGGAVTSWLSVCTTRLSAGAISLHATLGRRLYVWGQNNYGQLGTGDTSGRCSPTDIQSFCQFSMGYGSSAGVDTSGNLYTWGRNAYGQLANGNTVNQSTPVLISSGWTQVAVGLKAMAAIKTNGTLWTWGRNFYGQLGDNSTTDRTSPGTTVAGGTNWCAVSGPGEGSGLTAAFAAIKTDGTLWTWGKNTCGVLGDGTTTDRSSPVTVFGGGTTWCAVSMGGTAALALKTDGTLWSWGNNACGVLGDPTIPIIPQNSRCVPAQVCKNITTWTKISAGADSGGFCNSSAAISSI